MKQGQPPTPANPERRIALQAVAALAGVALVATAAQAATTDIVVHCDPPMAIPLRAIAAAYHRQSGVALRIFPTMPNGIPEQLAREIQNDLVVSTPEILARIGAAGALADVPPSAAWRNRLVIAARRGGLRRAFEQAVCAAPDPSWGGGPDGPAVLAGAGLRPGRTIGTYDTDEASVLLLTGEVDYALLHASEIAPDMERVDTPGLSAERIMRAVVTRSARRPNPEALLHFLASPEAEAALSAAGLEKLS